MGKIAFVFAGQGSQHSGMGLDLVENFKSSAKVFESLDKIRPETSKQCFYGSEEELFETRNTQPCLYAVEAACAAALAEGGISADMVAGFSLGELAALSYAGIVDLETGFKLVCRRGELMQKAAEAQPARMAAVLRLTADQVEELCSSFSNVYPVNYNSPGQTVVSGMAEQMDGFSQAVKEAGGRAIPLKVSGGFHSPFMSSASRAFRAELDSCKFLPGTLPIYSNCSGELYGSDVKELLAKQIESPVKWEKIVRNMIESGADTFIELGPGKTLCGLIRKIDAGVRTFSAEDKAGIDAIFSEVRPC